MLYIVFFAVMFVILIFILFFYNKFPFKRDSYSFVNPKSYEFNEIENLVKLYNQHKFDDMDTLITAYSENVNKRIQALVKAETLRVSHALSWQNAIPSYIQNLVLAITILSVVFSAINTTNSNVYWIIVTIFFVFYSAYIIWATWRRQILQNCAGAYEYILHMCKKG